jgi:hypothetical protein
MSNQIERGDGKLKSGHPPFLYPLIPRRKGKPLTMAGWFEVIVRYKNV